MNKNTRSIALCGTVCALCIVIMLLGGVLGLGTYAAPMIAGLHLIPIGDKYGKKIHLAVYAAVTLLSFILVPYFEQDLMLAVLFGPYPLLYPHFAKLPRFVRPALKLLWFNAVAIGAEALTMCLIAPEAMGKWAIIGLIAMGNLVFVLYDLVIKRSKIIIERLLGRILRYF